MAIAEIIGNRIILGEKNCICLDGTVAESEDCPQCKGTGRGPKGGAGGCKRCHGLRTVLVRKGKVCPDCNGTRIRPTTLSDWIPSEVWKSLEFKVYRQNRGVSWNEHNLGFGCVFSVSDYGDSRDWTDEQFIDSVKSHSQHANLSNIANEDGTLKAIHVAIVVHNSGYSVRFAHNPDGSDARLSAALELSESDGRRIGADVAAKGGNGTIAAIYG